MGAAAISLMPASEVTEETAPLDLEEAFRAHGRFVFRVLARLGVAPAALDDAVQDVFLVAHLRWSSYDPQASLRGWLFGIARRVASHQRRARGRADAHAARRPAPEPTTTPEQLAQEREAAEFVAEFVAALDEPKREVFVACCLEGMTAPEVSEALGVKLNTVYSRLRSAKEAFERAVQRRRLAEGKKR